MDGDRKIIAPFWADVDIRNNGGEVWYHQTRTEANLRKATSEIRAAYPYLVSDDVEITNLFIVTWKEVGYYNQKKDKVFVLVATYLILIYMATYILCSYV